MKNFEISKLKNSEYDYLVIATTYISPISTLDDVLVLNESESPALSRFSKVGA